MKLKILRSHSFAACTIAFAAAFLSQPITAGALDLWSISMGGTVSGSTLDGLSNPVWDLITAPATNPGVAVSESDLFDNNGANPIGFTITSGTVSEYGGRFAWNTSGNPMDLGFEITGLQPGAVYSLYSYGAGFGTRDFNLQVDQDGSGTLNGPTVNVFSSSTGSVIANIVADASGDIIGMAVSTPTDEADWTAFQLVETSAASAVPEPGAFLLTGLGLPLIVMLRRRRCSRS